MLRSKSYLLFRNLGNLKLQHWLCRWLLLASLILDIVSILWVRIYFNDRSEFSLFKFGAGVVRIFSLDLFSHRLLSWLLLLLHHVLGLEGRYERFWCINSIYLILGHTRLNRNYFLVLTLSDIGVVAACSCWIQRDSRGTYAIHRARHWVLQPLFLPFLVRLLLRLRLRLLNFLWLDNFTNIWAGVLRHNLLYLL